eukprot:scaffold128591_cov27-Prasinocladus_malaysianus.AAC.1
MPCLQTSLLVRATAKKRLGACGSPATRCSGQLGTGARDSGLAGHITHHPSSLAAGKFLDDTSGASTSTSTRPLVLHRVSEFPFSIRPIPVKTTMVWVAALSCTLSHTDHRCSPTTGTRKNTTYIPVVRTVQGAEPFLRWQLLKPVLRCYQRLCRPISIAWQPSQGSYRAKVGESLFINPSSSCAAAL